MAVDISLASTKTDDMSAGPIDHKNYSIRLFF